MFLDISRDMMMMMTMMMIFDSIQTNNNILISHASHHIIATLPWLSISVVRTSLPCINYAYTGRLYIVAYSPPAAELVIPYCA